MKITNQSGGMFSRALNDSTVFVILYEDVVPLAANSQTSRLDRAVAYQSIDTPLNHLETSTYPMFDLGPVGLIFVFTPKNLADPEAVFSISGMPSQFPCSVIAKPA